MMSIKKNYLANKTVLLTLFGLFMALMPACDKVKDPGEKEKDQEFCQKLDQAACKGSKKCTFTGSKCDAAASDILGTCMAIQLQKPCDDDTACEWDNTGAGVCKVKSVSALTYFELTFEEEVVEMKASDNSIDISAIGLSGDRSLIYFGTDSKVGEISAYAPGEAKATNIAAKEPSAGDNSPGKADLSGPLYPVYKIVSGPSNQTSAIAILSNTGLLEMKGKAVYGAWQNKDAHLNTAKDDLDLLSVAVLGDKWVLFGADYNSNGAHRTFGAPLGKAIKGPNDTKGGNPFGRYITATTVYRNEIYLASTTLPPRRLRLQSTVMT